MKSFSYILLFTLLTCVLACGSRRQSQENDHSAYAEIDGALKKTTLKFVALEHDFGMVKEGEKVKHVFEVLNTGEADLLLQDVRPSCGCTSPNYDKKPIRPGRKGTIEVVFDTKGRPGNQRKTVMVVTNTVPPNTVLSFICEVIPPEK